jgi:hypothetical protein
MSGIRSVVFPGLAASIQPGDSKPPDRFVRRLTIGFCLVALVLGALLKRGRRASR